ncbi:MAG TPA: metallophosphoesterase family protein [Candidatus Dormibacteraeota bacterium]|jgi:putative phosphoesterase
MRLAVVSDIHGNVSALEAIALDLKRQSPDLVVHGGDLALIGPRPAEVIDFIRAAGWPGVLGNTDQILFDSSGRADQVAGAPQLRGWLKTLFDDFVPWAQEHLSRDQISWLEGLPLQWRSDGVVLVHAAPDDLWRAPMPDSPVDDMRRVYGVLGSRLAVYGHIHRPFVKDVGGFTVANAGSVGLPYDGDPRASYLLIDDEVPAVRRVEYDLDQAASDAEAAEFPLATWLTDVQHQARFRSP